MLSAVLTRRVRDAGWLALAVIGIGLLGLDGAIGADPLDPIGVMFALIAAAFWALYIRATAHAGATTIPVTRDSRSRSPSRRS
ncbi:hypothetical protein OED01_02940 [Microbacterium sp. M28]|uniref:hypothetical protein n=1 Tax=Microbacterium sp. M28 TaxID=2962064 RepID=UPI0021F41ABB|nr:hypothetical protein [Microbacterium sp. M28]UYO97691.1 hypothetical protein OED01_02940 [Microbacterium sp. M28]